MIKDSKYICTKCGCVVKPSTKVKYPIFIRLIFALLFVLSVIACFTSFNGPAEISAIVFPASLGSALFFLITDAILYCILAKHHCCPVCDGEGTIIPTSTPIGKMLMADIMEKVINKNTAKPEPKPETKDE